MKVRYINKHGYGFEFKSCKAAKPHIKKSAWKNYTTVKENGKSVRVYDDRDLNY